MFALPPICQSLPQDVLQRFEVLLQRQLLYVPWLKGKMNDSEITEVEQNLLQRAAQERQGSSIREVVWLTELDEVETALHSPELQRQRRQEREQGWKRLLSFAQQHNRSTLMQEAHFAIRQEVLRQRDRFALPAACEMASEDMSLGLSEHLLVDIGWKLTSTASIAHLWALGFWPLGSWKSRLFVYALPVKEEQQTHLMGSTGTGFSLVELSIEVEQKKEKERSVVLDPTLQMEQFNVTEKEQPVNNSASDATETREKTESLGAPASEQAQAASATSQDSALEEEQPIEAVSSETVAFGIEDSIDPHKVSPSAEVNLQELGELQGTLLDDDEQDQGSQTQEAGSTPSLVTDDEEETTETREVSARRPRKQEQRPRLEHMASAPPENEQAKSHTQELSGTSKSEAESAVERNITLGMAPGGLSDDLMSELFGGGAPDSATSAPPVSTAPVSTEPIGFEMPDSPGATATYLPAFGNVEADGKKIIQSSAPKAQTQPISKAQASGLSISTEEAAGSVRGTAMYLPAITDVATGSSDQARAVTSTSSQQTRTSSEAKISIGASQASPSPRGTAMYLEAISPEQESQMRQAAAPQVQASSPPQTSAPEISPGATAMYMPAMDAPPTMQMDQPRFSSNRPQAPTGPGATAMYTPAATQPPTLQSGPQAIQPQPHLQQPQPHLQQPQPPQQAGLAMGQARPMYQSGAPVQPQPHAPHPPQQSWPHQPPSMSDVVPSQAVPLSPYHQGGEPVRVSPSPSALSAVNDDYDLDVDPGHNKKSRLLLWIVLFVLFLGGGAAVYWFLKNNSAPALFAKAVSAQKAGQCKKALNWVEKVLKKEASFKGAHRLQGQCEHKLEQFDKALITLQKAVALDKNDKKSLWLVGLLLEKKGKWPESRNQFKSLTELDSGNASYWNAYGRLLNRLGQYSDARKALRKAIQLDGKQAVYWNNLGAVLLRQAQKDPKNTDSPALARQAEANFRKALVLSPQLGAALRNLGDALLYQATGVKKRKERENMLSKADKAYKQAKLILSSDAGLLLQMGRLKIQQYQYQSAVPLLNQALSEYKSVNYANYPHKDLLRANALYNLSVALEGAGKIDDAIQKLREFVQLKSDSADGYCRLGQLLRTKRDRKASKAAYARCLQLDPTDKDARRYGR